MSSSNWSGTSYYKDNYYMENPYEEYHAEIYSEGFEYELAKREGYRFGIIDMRDSPTSMTTRLVFENKHKCEYFMKTARRLEEQRREEYPPMRAIATPQESSTVDPMLQGRSADLVIYDEYNDCNDSEEKKSISSLIGKLRLQAISNNR